MKNFIVNGVIPYITRKVKEKKITNPHVILNLDCWKVHISKEFLAWMKQYYPFIHIVFVPAGCTGKFQVCDLVVQKKLKDVVCKQAQGYIASEVLQQLKTRKSEDQQIRVAVQLSVIKPKLVQWVKQAYQWFQSEEGKSLILKGFEKAGISQVWNLDFQREAGIYPILT